MVFPDSLQIMIIVGDLLLGVVLGFEIGSIITRRKIEKKFRELLQEYAVRGRMTYASPSLLMYAIQRAGAYLPSSILEEKEEGSEE